MDQSHVMALNDEDLFDNALEEDSLPETAKAHLERCEICQQRLDRLKHFNATLGRLYRSQCPDGMQLSLYCEELLPSEGRTRIAAHILQCPQCRMDVATTRSFISNTSLALEPVLPSPLASVRSIFATLMRQQPQLVTRNGGKSARMGWPRQYRADNIDLSLHLTRASSGACMLLGILTSADESENVDSFEGAHVELHSTPLVEPVEENYATAAGHVAMVDDLGNIVFSAVQAGTYTMTLRLPGRDILVEGLDID